MHWSDLQRAIAAWDDYSRTETADSIRRVRQVAYLLYRDLGDRQSFLPMRLLIGWTQGIPFDRQGGRSVGIRDRFTSLAEIGLARIEEASPFFDLFWDRYTRHCAELGQPPACYIGDNPRTGRVFWSYPV